MWNNDVILVQQERTEIDNIGQSKPIETETHILAQEKQATNAMLFYASQFGFKLSLVLIVHTYEYEGQSIIIYNGKRYKVKRVYKESLEITELHCEEIITNASKRQ